MPLLIWEARVYMSPRRPPQRKSPQSADPESSPASISSEAYQFVRTQFEARQKQFEPQTDGYSWQQFCGENGFGPAPKTAPPSTRKHGLYAQTLTLTPEEATALDLLRKELQEIHQPATPDALELVNEIAECSIRLQQLRGYESESVEPWVNLKPQIRKVIRSTERRIERAESELRNPKLRSRASSA